MRATTLFVLALAFTAQCAVAFYLPGVAPQQYAEGETVALKVNKLDSVKTQLPYKYYDLPFCAPANPVEENENLGEILAGDIIETSVYEIRMRVPEYCKILCKKDYNKADLEAFADKVADEYRVNWIVDNLPAVTKYFTEAEPDTDEAAAPEPNAQAGYVPHYEKGYALGFTGGKDYPNTKEGSRYLNNHVRLILLYHEDQNAFTGNRIVGFEVEPFSVKHQIEGNWIDPRSSKLKTCNPSTGLTQGVAPQSVDPVDSETIIFTYDVWWEESVTKWASRWDVYLKMADPQIHWFSIVNSIMIVLFLTGMIAMIMMRTLHKDLIAYNQVDQSEEAQQEETGWKLIYGEVFRPPQYGGFLSVLVGTGVQVFAMTVLTLGFAVLGFLSPANRGGLMTALLLLFVFMGVFAGYFATRTYSKVFHLTDWKKNTAITATFFPGVCFVVFFILNLFVWGQKSSGAVPFTTLLALLVLWFGISVPLVYIGSYFAFKNPDIKPPVQVNSIPRMIPEQAWYMRSQFSVLVGGVLPFGAVFIEVFFIMSSVWLHQFYYAFAFLFLVFVILIITCAEITIVMCYFQLCGEDYHWWWRSYLTAGSSALYLFLYSILYFFTKLEIIKFIPGLLFFGYMFLVSFAFFVLTGTIGFFACYLFVWKIYSSIKVD
jgi:transmembrane 9 superfamily protein 2/4